MSNPNRLTSIYQENICIRGAHMPGCDVVPSESWAEQRAASAVAATPEPAPAVVPGDAELERLEAEYLTAQREFARLPPPTKRGRCPENVRRAAATRHLVASKQALADAVSLRPDRRWGRWVIRSGGQVFDAQTRSQGGRPKRGEVA